MVSLNFKYSVNKLVDFYFFHLRRWYIFLYGKCISIVIIIIVIKLQKYANITLVNAHKKEILCSSIIILIYANIHMSQRHRKLFKRLKITLEAMIKNSR